MSLERSLSPESQAFAVLTALSREMDDGAWEFATEEAEHLARLLKKLHAAETAGAE